MFEESLVNRSITTIQAFFAVSRFQDQGSQFGADAYEKIPNVTTLLNVMLPISDKLYISKTIPFKCCA